jgi:Skp family chaperone for outer membrane proteins
MHACSRLFLSLCLTFSLVFTMMASAPAMAKETGVVTKVAVVDVQRLMSVSKVAKNIQKQLEAERKNFEKEFEEHETRLRDTEKKLGEQRDSMKPDEFKEKRIAFENELLQTRKLVQTRRRALEGAASKALVTVRKEILEIVANIADKDKYDLVIGRENVILASRAMDITDTVLKELDSKLSKVDLKVEDK